MQIALKFAIEYEIKNEDLSSDSEINERALDDLTNKIKLFIIQ